MRSTRRSTERLLVMLALVVAGFALWRAHARAWDLGNRSPVLSFDAAQYALAARTLAEQGRLATTFALPIELVRHPAPPWPLAVVQPGLVLVEAALERLVPPEIRIGSTRVATLRMPYQREWITLLLPFVCYLTLGALLSLVTARLIERHAPGRPRWEGALAGAVVGLAFLLDPEAQHFAVGGFTELPYTLGVVAAIALVATGRAARAPLLFGLLLGVTGAFRGNLLWLLPAFAAAVAATSEPARRWRAAVLTLLGFAVPLAPWWIYKWRQFGHPGFDLSALGLWDGAGGHTWFSLTHLPEFPEVPTGGEAVRLLLAKLRRNLETLGLALLHGPRGLWAGALAVWLLAARPVVRLRVAGWLVLVQAAIGLLVAALGASWLRYLFPGRVPLEAAGLLATWAILARLTPGTLGPGTARMLQAAVAVLAIGWGSLQTVRGNREASAVAERRALPSVTALRNLAHRLRREVPVEQTVMSNLGPTLAWYARRPVLHLALTPADIEACRERLPFDHVVLGFREAEAAWPGWEEVLARPEETTSRPEWNVRRARSWTLFDGSARYVMVWLELGPPRPRLAAGSDPRPGAMPAASGEARP